MPLLKEWMTARSVRRAADRTCKWLIASREGFLVTQADADQHVPGNEVPWRVKPLFELVLFLSLMQRRGERSRQLRVLNGFAITQVTRFDWHDLARFDAAAGAPLATLAEFCVTNGQPVPFEPDYLALLQSSGFLEGMDRMPYREMEVRHAFALAFGQQVGPRLEESFARTAFGRGQMLCRYSVDDAYSLTHALFYLTDFGHRPIADLLPASEVARIREHLNALMVLMLRSDNADVLGELLICWRMCGFTAVGAEVIVLEVGLGRLLALATPAGAVPPTQAVRDRFVTGGAGFVEVYHTTLVAAILFHLLAAQR